MPFVTDEVVTAAKLNLATFVDSEVGTFDRNGFTNTAFADLDALTAGSGTGTAVIVTATTGVLAIVSMSATLAASAGSVLLSYRVSGATTIAASAATGPRNASTALITCSYTMPVVLTAGVNVFELQASVTAGTGRIINPSLTVETVI